MKYNFIFKLDFNSPHMLFTSAHHAEHFIGAIVGCQGRISGTQQLR